MNFIDLFAGIGGFHQAMTRLGHTCVFASEKKEFLARLYERNYGIIPNRDIRAVAVEDIPDHDILCAGFPCQPFSKAGNQHGLQDETNGNFFDLLVDIINKKRPRYFILENVRNLETHNEKLTWNHIHDSLTRIGYHIDKNVMSPHQYNIPQHRERLFIVGSLRPLDNFQWPEKMQLTANIRDFLSNENSKPLEKEKSEVIDVWQEFVDALEKHEKIPGFPIWAMDFGATYPLDRPISQLKDEELEAYRGNFGIPLKGMTYEQKLANLPSYAVRNKSTEEYPSWKIRWIKDNRKLYDDNKSVLKPVVKKIKAFPVRSWQKFEWNCGDVSRNVRDHILQFRASGVRVKRADFFPSLVTVSTQIPIIGWENRYLTTAEGSTIQSFENIVLPDNLGSSFGALGNAVNVRLVELIANSLILEEVQVI